MTGFFSKTRGSKIIFRGYDFSRHPMTRTKEQLDLDIALKPVFDTVVRGK